MLYIYIKCLKTDPTAGCGDPLACAGLEGEAKRGRERQREAERERGREGERERGRERERVTELKRPDCPVGFSGPGTA